MAAVVASPKATPAAFFLALGVAQGEIEWPQNFGRSYRDALIVGVRSKSCFPPVQFNFQNGNNCAPNSPSLPFSPPPPFPLPPFFLHLTIILYFCPSSTHVLFQYLFFSLNQNPRSLIVFSNFSSISSHRVLLSALTSPLPALPLPFPLPFLHTLFLFHLTSVFFPPFIKSPTDSSFNNNATGVHFF